MTMKKRPGGAGRPARGPFTASGACSRSRQRGASEGRETAHREGRIPVGHSGGALFEEKIQKISEKRARR